MEEIFNPDLEPGRDPLSEASSLPATGLTLSRYERAMREAQTLLAGGADDSPAQLECLNCGKFGKLVSYIRSGIPGLLLIAGYAEYSFR